MAEAYTHPWIAELPRCAVFLQSTDNESSNELPYIFSALISSPIDTLSLAYERWLSEVLPSTAAVSPTSDSAESPKADSLRKVSFFFPSQVAFTRNTSEFFELSDSFSTF